MSKLTISFIIALLCLSSCNQAESLENKSNVIHISTTINNLTRTSKTSFIAGDAISVYAYETGDIEKLVINNSINTYDGTAWNAVPEMKWGDQSIKYDFLGVYPTRNITDFTSTNFTLESEMIKNDLLVATNKNVSSAKAWDILLDFTHIMSKVTVNLSYKSDLETEPIVKRVLLKSMNNGQINFITKEVTANGTEAEIELEKVNNNQHVGITIPQTIATATKMIFIYVEGEEKPYVYTTATAIDLKTNKHTILNLILGEGNTIELKNSSINPWGESDSVDGGTEGPDKDQIEPGPWEDGEDGSISPDLNQTVTLNSEKYEIPDKSEMDFTNKTLSVSHRGGVAELNFNGKFDKVLTLLTSDPRLTIVPSSETKYKNSRFMITATQPLDGKEYTVKFRVAHSLVPTTKFIDVTVRVMGNTIPSVVIGNLEWMIYNGCGRSRELYPPLEVNQTVRDVYQQKWHKYSANCMWGDRLPPVKPLIYPWEVVQSLNTGGTSIGSSVPSWPNNSTTIPCPEGWRVPTKEEINMIWPDHSVDAVGKYTKGGVTYTATIEDSGAPDIFVNATTTISPKIYVLSFGKNELIFPMTGWRRRNDYAGNQALVAVDAGVAFYLWTQSKGSAGWTAYIVGVTRENKSFNAASSGQEAMTEAYNGVRCVRTVE